MRKLLDVRKLFRLFVLILLAPLLYAFVYEAGAFLVTHASGYFLSAFMAGLAAYLFMYPVLFHDKINFLEHFGHELSHAIVAVMLMRPVNSLTVNPTEGSAVNTSNPGCLIHLAPYYLPVFVFPLLIVKLVMIPLLHWVIDLLIGIATAFHIASVLKTFRLRQTDIQRTGLIVSICVTVAVNAAFLVVIVSGVIDDYLAAWAYVQSSVIRAGEFYRAVLGSLIGVLAGANPFAS
jgi:hypothetical protein